LIRQLPDLQLPKALPLTRVPKPPGVTCAKADAGSMEARIIANRQIKFIEFSSVGALLFALLPGSVTEEDRLSANWAMRPGLLILRCDFNGHTSLCYHGMMGFFNAAYNGHLEKFEFQRGRSK
jgi:hypothetical protein